MATLPTHNPVIPHLSLIPGGLRHGLMIRVKGQMIHGGTRFNIHIQTGAALKPRDDVALHLSIRPREHTIVRNTLENQIWGSEERHGGCPIQPGQYFDILILAESTAYKIAINNTHFCHFNHRIPLHRALYCSIDGEVTINSIILEGDSGPSAVPSAPYPIATPPRFPSGGVQVLPVIPPPYAPSPPPPPPYTQYPAYRPPHGHPGHPGHPTFTPYTPMNEYPHSPGYPPHYNHPHHYHHEHHECNCKANLYRRPCCCHNRADRHRVGKDAFNKNCSVKQQQQELEAKKKKKKKRNKALKYAAGIGGIGLGAYAVSRAMGSGDGEGSGSGSDSNGD